ncbi:MAG: T9SS type A sorting domain-containing protein [Candidatus Kryptoniota bacterium]
MSRKHFIALMLAASISFMLATANAQEFPVAVGGVSTFAQGGAFDGTHYLWGLVSDSNDLTAQFLSAGNSLYGSRFSLNAKGTGLRIAFDGTNYLAVWTDPFPYFASGDTNGIGNLHGQFLTTSGSFVGNQFTIATAVNIKFGQGRGELIFNGSDYILMYEKGGNDQDHLFGQLIDRSGNLVGSPIQISSSYARDMSIGFDGTNYLTAWCEESETQEDNVYGQFFSNQGTLVGSNFLIDGSQNASDNPVSVAFDGSRYLVAFHDQAADGVRWNLYGRFVYPTGSVAPDKMTICDSSRSPFNAFVAFDGTNYLATWIEAVGPMNVKGRFFCTTGVPIDTAFEVFDTLGGKAAVGGVSDFGNGHYRLGATRVTMNMTDGDVYGKTIDPLSVGGSSLLGTWTKANGPADVLTYYFNSKSLVTMSMDFDTLMTASYAVDSSVTPHHISWYASSGKLGNLGIWKIEGNTLTVKATGGDTTTFPTTFDPETKYPSEATAYTKVAQVTDVKTNVSEMPKSFGLFQNYPNPFNPSTKINYQLPLNSIVTLKIYDVLGREVETLINERQAAGSHSAAFNASSLPSGVYFYHLQAGSYSATKKLLLLK